MKKFNILALAALALSCLGTVSATSATNWGLTSTALTPLSTGLTPTASDYRKSLRTLAQGPSNSTVVSQIASGTTPITATGSLTSKTNAKVKSSFDAAAFAAGAQINNTQSSGVQGSVNSQGPITAASNTASVANLSGSNLLNVVKGLGGTSATGGTSTTGLAGQASSGALNLANTNTKNKVSAKFTNSGGAGTGSLGNTTNNLSAMTAGATNYSGAVTGSQNAQSFFGNAFNPNS